MASGRVHDVTALLLAWRGGDEAALPALLPLVHGELRRLARLYMAGERQGHLLQPTALVNEAFLRLVDVRRIAWRDRAHFYAMAARLMRQVLVDVARAEKNQKRGGAYQRVTLDQDVPGRTQSPVDVIAVDDALDALAREYPRKAEVVELRYFAGLAVEECAEALGVSAETVMRDWKFARSWLLRALRGNAPPSEAPPGDSLRPPSPPSPGSDRR